MIGQICSHLCLKNLIFSMILTSIWEIKSKKQKALSMTFNVAPSIPLFEKANSISDMIPDANVLVY